ncbi:ubiquitin receptor RAD23b-like isoform X2 [Oryza glaberrima]|uniref:ubiquitin receptor RAD23b-like isoform X2 n=1 Tax=Oryza glaberrima TaxID=4538 RepID=UPI00224C580B|nr:ubiquitin receptor RAD23b-like isoform X2 [Oryza glaberrima]
MKLTVKTLKGTQFEIRVQPNDTIMAVKKIIEEIQGKDSYPWGQQLLIHNGKVLKDESTLEENKVSEVGFLVVMLSKSKASGSSGALSSLTSSTPLTRQETPADASRAAPQPLVAPTRTPQPERPPAEAPSNAYGQAASNLLSGSNLDTTINQLMEMGGGSWDRDKVQRALRAAYNNPERAVEYLYSGIPITAEVAVPTGGQGANTTEPSSTREASLSGIPNSSPLNLFPQGDANDGGGAGGGTLEFLRHNQQFQALREMVHTNPQILQPMLQELSKKNPQLLRLIQENHDEFLQLINEPFDGADGDFLDQPDQDEMPHSINVTPEEQEAIGRLEGMGFDRARVIEAFFACDRNEQLAANYLLEHAADED